MTNRPKRREENQAGLPSITLSVQGDSMANPSDPTDLVILEELTISNMWETVALVEVLEKKGLLPKEKG